RRHARRRPQPLARRRERPLIPLSSASHPGAAGSSLTPPDAGRPAAGRPKENPVRVPTTVRNAVVITGAFGALGIGGTAAAGVGPFAGPTSTEIGDGVTTGPDGSAPAPSVAPTDLTAPSAVTAVSATSAVTPMTPASALTPASVASPMTPPSPASPVS